MVVIYIRVVLLIQYNKSMVCKKTKFRRLTYIIIRLLNEAIDIRVGSRWLCIRLMTFVELIYCR